MCVYFFGDRIIPFDGLVIFKKQSLEIVTKYITPCVSKC